ILGLIAALPLLAMASEGAPAERAGITLGPLFFSTINFLIFGWIVVRYVLPVARDWARARHARVVRTLDEAAAAKAEAMKLRAQWDERMARLDEEIAVIRAEAQRDAAREREQILAAARKLAEVIRRDAERAADYEVRRVQQQLRAELVQQAVRLAKE